MGHEKDRGSGNQVFGFDSHRPVDSPIDTRISRGLPTNQADQDNRGASKDDTGFIEIGGRTFTTIKRRAGFLGYSAPVDSQSGDSERSRSAEEAPASSLGSAAEGTGEFPDYYYHDDEAEFFSKHNGRSLHIFFRPRNHEHDFDPNNNHPTAIVSHLYNQHDELLSAYRDSERAMPKEVEQQEQSQQLVSGVKLAREIQLVVGLLVLLIMVVTAGLFMTSQQNANLIRNNHKLGCDNNALLSKHLGISPSINCQGDNK